MAQQSANKNNAPKFTLWSKVAPLKENRDGKEKPPVGRFKYYMAVHRTFSTPLMLLNLFTFLFFAPIIGFAVFVETIGLESFTYLINGVASADIPYYMTGLGVGLSQGVSATLGALDLIKGRMLELLIIGAGISITGIGLSGLYSVAHKMYWREGFVAYKKNKVGVYVPRLFKEYLVGVKKYWLPTTVITTIMGAVFAGVSAAVCHLAYTIEAGTAGGGEWVLAIFACIIGLYIYLVSFTMLPQVSQYVGSYAKRIQNSMLFAILEFLPLMFIFGALVLIAYLTTRGQLWMILFLSFIMLFMIEFLVLTTTNFSHYLSQMIVTPLYEQTLVKHQRVERKKGKKK